MCGIAGLIAAPDAPGPDPTVLSTLERALAHRGPDGAGHSVVGRIALVHTRLAIIDLAGGDQPLFAGSAALVGNGEVYNYRELRADLPNVKFDEQRQRAAAASLAARRRGVRDASAGHVRPCGP